jgi:tripartite-type tricarboxylate transporter receptor subunit TctC
MMIAKACPTATPWATEIVTSLAINRTLPTTQPYDVDKDLQPAAQVHYQSNVLAVTPALPRADGQRPYRPRKEAPGTIAYGSAGNGTSGHLSAELFKYMTDTQIEHMPLQARQPAGDHRLIGGHIVDVQ